MKQQQIDWTAGDRQAMSAHRIWLRSLSEEESVRLYFSLARFALAQRNGSDGWRRLEEQRLQDKLIVRRKWLRVLTSSDGRDDR